MKREVNAERSDETFITEQMAREAADSLIGNMTNWSWSIASVSGMYTATLMQYGVLTQGMLIQYGYMPQDTATFDTYIEALKWICQSLFSKNTQQGIANMLGKNDVVNKV